MALFANRFSKIAIGLLILVVFPQTTTYGDMTHMLKDSELKKEPPRMPTRAEVPLEYRWNIEALYQNPELWMIDFKETQGQENGVRWPELSFYRGRLSDPAQVQKFFQLSFELEQKLEKLYVYAHTRQDEDLGNDQFKHNLNLITSLIHQYRLETAWIEPEILALNDREFQKIYTHPDLSLFQFYLEKVRRKKPHTLAPDMEEMLALSGKALASSASAFIALNNADLVFEDAIDSFGKKQPLTVGTYSSYLRSGDRTLRKTAFQNLFKGYEMHINTITELLQGHIESHVYIAKARKFPSCLNAALYRHDIDPIVYTNLISSIRKHLPSMHKYVALRKKLMKIEEVHPYDLYVPLVEGVRMNIDYKEACDLVLASVAPLGEEYQEALRKGLFEEQWVDVYENAKKRSGAYSTGCYDSMPYILMNYHNTLNDVFTLAHEAGHSMHKLLSTKHQPYLYFEYPIFLAEIASTFNEQLLLRYLKEHAKNREERAYLIVQEIEGIRGTIFRQTLFAEFEKQIHEWAEKGTPLTPTLLKNYYLELNRDYYGPDLILDEEIGLEWARIPHFYSDFYVYQYATGQSASYALYLDVMESSDAKDRYLELLSSGGKNFPLDLLKKAGVDMKKTSAVDRALEHFNELLGELEACLSSSR